MAVEAIKQAMTRATLALLLAAGACTPMAESVQDGGNTLKTSLADDGAAWKDLLTYHPKSKTPQLPQTRYCYKAQTDIVCYDSAQHGMTEQLVGYQDGDSMSWIQPGGGSLGVSGGEPTAPQNAEHVHIAPNLAGSAAVITTSVPDSVSPVINSTDESVSSNDISTAPVGTPQVPASAPFQRGQSSYSLPPTKAD